MFQPFYILAFFRCMLHYMIYFSDLYAQLCLLDSWRFSCFTFWPSSDVYFVICFAIPTVMLIAVILLTTFRHFYGLFFFRCLFYYMLWYSDHHTPFSYYARNVSVVVWWGFLQESFLLYILLFGPAWSYWLFSSKRFDHLAFWPSSGFYLICFSVRTNNVSAIVSTTNTGILRRLQATTAETFSS